MTRSVDASLGAHSTSLWNVFRTFRVVGVAIILGVLMVHPVLGASENGMDPEKAKKLGEKFGVVVGEVDQEIADFLGLPRPEGVVVFEVIGGRPADLAGIKVKAIIKEIDKEEIATLEDFGLALKKAMPKGNFSVATFEPADPSTQGVGGGINFHFVRINEN